MNCEKIKLRLESLDSTFVSIMPVKIKNAEGMTKIKRIILSVFLLIRERRLKLSFQKNAAKKITKTSAYTGVLVPVIRSWYKAIRKRRPIAKIENRLCRLMKINFNKKTKHASPMY